MVENSDTAGTGFLTVGPRNLSFDGAVVVGGTGFGEGFIGESSAGTTSSTAFLFNPTHNVNTVPCP